MHVNTSTAVRRLRWTVAAQEGLDELLQLARAALHDVLHAEHAFVFIFDVPRNELWTNFALPGKPEGGGARCVLRVPCVLRARTDQRRAGLRLWAERPARRPAPRGRGSQAGAAAW